MENNKYYTADIEDLRVGYICETKPGMSEAFTWMPYIINGDNSIKAHYRDQIRTKYLTKEDIESLGWKINIEYNHLSRCGFEKDNYYLLLNTRNQIPFIKIIYKDPSKEEDGWIVAPEHFQISIQCPSINELKTIEKLLNIK